MGIIAADLFITLDGVYQAPGGRDEDREGDFAFGGWQAPYTDEAIGASIMASIERTDALLLGGDDLLVGMNGGRGGAEGVELRLEDGAEPEERGLGREVRDPLLEAFEGGARVAGAARLGDRVGHVANDDDAFARVAVDRALALPRRAEAREEHDGPCPGEGEDEESPPRQVHGANAPWRRTATAEPPW